MSIIDIVGQTCKGWTAISYHHGDSRGNAYWLCECECGNTRIISGYCFRHGKISLCQCHYINKMLNRRFGSLIVVEFSCMKKRQYYFLCKCDCGNEKVVRAGHLLDGTTISCGCHRIKLAKERYADRLVGKRFGHWTVKCKSHSDKDRRNHWLCVCDCGTERSVGGDALQKGDSLSCGCSRVSRGEEEISSILDELDICYIREYKFDDCVDVRNLRFDFFLPDYDMCIEFHGLQHFEAVEYFGGEERLINQQRRDKIKRDFCKNNGLTLLEIPYHEKHLKEKIEFVLKNLKT